MYYLTAHWSASWVAVAAYVVVAAAHLAGLRRMLAASAHSGQDEPSARQLRREAWLFQSGLAITVLSIVSPLGYWTDVYIWVRAVQALMLAFVGPALIVAGAPWLPLRRAFARGSSAAAEPGKADRADRVPVFLRYPVATVVAFNVVWLGWQFPALLDAAHGSAAVSFADHVTYIAAGILLWLQLIGSRPFSPAASPLRRAALIVATVGVGTVLGMVLVFGNGVLYPVYSNSAHHIMTVLDDQQLAGAVLWMGMLPGMICGAVVVLTQWLRDEESEELSAGLDRLLTQRKSSWPSRPGLR